MKNKSIIIGLIVFVLFLGGIYLTYNKLSAKFQENSLKAQEELKKDNENQVEENSTTSEEETKKLATDFLVYDGDNNPVKLSDYKGTPIVLNFWSSWCPPCKVEMPYFKKVTDKYEDDELKVIMLNVTDGQKETMDSAKSYMEDNNYDMMTLPGKIAYPDWQVGTLVVSGLDYDFHTIKIGNVDTSNYRDDFHMYGGAAVANRQSLTSMQTFTFINRYIVFAIMCRGWHF